MACKIWEPKTCCCGASLRTGTLVLGWITLVLFALDFIGVLGATLNFSDVNEDCIKELEKEHDPYLNAYGESLCYNIGVGFLVGWGAFSLMVVLFSILLLMGVNKNKPKLMLPYLIGEAIVTLLFLVLVVGTLGLTIIQLNLVGFFIILLCFSPILALQIYLLLIVYGCYKEITRAREQGWNNLDPEEQGELRKI